MSEEPKGHIATAVKALEKQVEKNIDLINKFSTKARECEVSIEKLKVSCDNLKQQIKALKGESSVETLTDISKGLK